MSPGQLLDNTTYTDGFKDLTSCPVIPKPPENALRRPDSGYAGIVGANDGCSVVLDNVPGHQDVAANANGVLVPNGVNVPSRNLQLGDAIEFTGSFFSSRQRVTHWVSGSSSTGLEKSLKRTLPRPIRGSPTRGV